VLQRRREDFALIQKTILPFIFVGLLLAGCSKAYYSPSDFPTESDSEPLLPFSSDTPPTEAPVPTEEPVPTEIPPDPLTITIVYDNVPNDPRLTADLGFGAYIEYHGQVILFDTGRDSGILLQNMQTLDIDPANIETVVLSHIDDDHTGGLEDSCLFLPSRRSTCFRLFLTGSSKEPTKRPK